MALLINPPLFSTLPIEIYKMHIFPHFLLRDFISFRWCCKEAKSITDSPPFKAALEELERLCKEFSAIDHRVVTFSMSELFYRIRRWNLIASMGFCRSSVTNHNRYEEWFVKSLYRYGDCMRSFHVVNPMPTLFNKPGCSPLPSYLLGLLKELSPLGEGIFTTLPVGVHLGTIQELLAFLNFHIICDMIMQMETSSTQATIQYTDLVKAVENICYRYNQYECGTFGASSWQLYIGVHRWIVSFPISNNEKCDLNWLNHFYIKFQSPFKRAVRQLGVILNVWLEREPVTLLKNVDLPLRVMAIFAATIFRREKELTLLLDNGTIPACFDFFNWILPLCNTATTSIVPFILQRFPSLAKLFPLY